MFILVASCLMCLNVAAQLQGSFGYGNDGHIYFYLHNPTPFYFIIGFGPINYETEEVRSHGGTLYSQQTLAYGPNYSWVWQKGEAFLVTYSDGRSEKWICPKDDPSLSRRSNPSFGASTCEKYRGKKCSVQGPYDAIPCQCSGFSCQHWDASKCSKCPHKATDHTR